MKCPNCGFVSFPGLDQCKKCGHPFAKDESPKAGIPPLFSLPSKISHQPVDVVFGGSKGQVESTPVEGKGQEGPVDPRKAFLDLPGPRPPEIEISRSNPPMDWQKEISERMQEYRRRRERIAKSKEKEGNTLNLDFNSSALDSENPRSTGNVIEFPSFDEPDSEEGPEPDPDLNSNAFVEPDILDEALTRDKAKLDVGPFRVERPAPTAPMEIELEPSPALGDAEGRTAVLKIAPLGKRLLAGVFDLFVLLSSASMFAAIFWQTGGKLSSQPLDLVAVGLAGAILLMAYFGIFTVFAYGTPGLIWAGLEVRTIEGNPPKRIDCFWRAFGYLVSISALMLGFIWALVDGDGLTWHDRMSRTLLVYSQESENLQAAESLSQYGHG